MASASPHGIITNPRDPFGFQPSPLVSAELVALCLDAFFTHKYPITPILDRRQMEAALPHLAALPELYALLTACCAVMVLSPEILASSSPSSPSTSPSSPSAASISTSTSISISPAPPTLPTAEFLISETTRARQFCNYIESPSLTTVQTSFFLFSAFFCLGRDNSAWFYIREAITMLQLLRLHEEDTYAFLSPDEAAFSRRLFWVLFITERAYALQRHRLLTLQRTLALPAVDPAAPEAHILSGFLDLISLFQHFDNDFLALWNLPLATPPPAGTPPPEPLTRLQSVLARRGPPPGHCAESQQADLVVSRQWLKTMVWQLCVSKTPLPSSSRSRSRTADDSMTLHYPVTIAREVVAAARHLPRGALEANGVGIVEKVFDIGCSLADVLALAPCAAPPEALAVGPRDCLVELVRIVGNTVRGGAESRHLRVLVAKASECLRVGVDRGVGVVGAGVAGWGSREGGREVYELCGDGDGDDAAEGDAEVVCEMSGNDGLDDHYLLSGYQGDWGEEGEGVSDEGTEFFLPYP